MDGGGAARADERLCLETTDMLLRSLDDISVADLAVQRRRNAAFGVKARGLGGGGLIDLQQASASLPGAHLEFLRAPAQQRLALFFVHAGSAAARREGGLI
jgi:hypothetical protein